MITPKKFKLSIERDLYIPDVKLFRMDLKTLVENAIRLNSIQDEEFKKLPSWQKYIKNPNKAKAFFISMLQSLFEGKHNRLELNVDYQIQSTGEIREGRRVAMLWLPHNTQTKNLDIIEKHANSALSGFRIIKLHGMQRMTTNAKAEAYVKEQLEAYPDSDFLILSAQIGQRSFSVGEIDEVYLAYDNGEKGSTIQKMSRALTGLDPDKIGKIFSLSFDPNRDDKFSGLILESAEELSRERGTSIKTELPNVLSSFDIFSCSEDGSTLIQADEFIKNSIENNTMGKAIAMMTPIENFNMVELIELAAGNGWEPTEGEIEKAQKGKVTDHKKEVGRNPSRREKDLQAKARETILNIVENSDIFILSTGANGIKNAIEEIEKRGIQADVERRFSISFLLYKNLINSDRINSSWIDCISL